jgi:hypothetical protein
MDQNLSQHVLPKIKLLIFDLLYSTVKVEGKSYLCSNASVIARSKATYRKLKETSQRFKLPSGAGGNCCWDYLSSKN